MYFNTYSLNLLSKHVMYYIKINDFTEDLMRALCDGNNQWLFP